MPIRVHVVQLAFVLSALPGCISPTVRLIPVAHPLGSAGERARAELRIPQTDARTRRICAQNFATDCLDSFWRIEVARPSQVVFRYRRVAMSEVDARAPASFVARITLVTNTGKTAHARLSDTFAAVPMSGLEWKDRAVVVTGTDYYARPGDGKIVAHAVLGTGTSDQSTLRYSGENYVVFDGDSLITPDTTWVELDVKGGLLGGGARMRFSFVDEPPQNAEISIDPKHDRPDLARFGPVHR